MKLVCLLLTLVLFDLFKRTQLDNSFQLNPNDPKLLVMLSSVESQFPDKLHTTGSGLYYRIGKVLAATMQINATGVATQIDFELFQRPCEQETSCSEQENICFAYIFDETSGKRNLNILSCLKE